MNTVVDTEKDIPNKMVPESVVVLTYTDHSITDADLDAIGRRFELLGLGFVPVKYALGGEARPPQIECIRII